LPANRLYKAESTVTIELLNPPDDDLLVLDVGEFYTFEVSILSDEPFVLAMIMASAYSPRRSIHWHGIDRATRDTYALLQLTTTGNNPTTDLNYVCDWPEPGDCWDDGVAPVSIVVGLRYKGGVVISEAFSFAVKVLLP
jgi:hypothetical protein